MTPPKTPTIDPHITSDTRTRPDPSDLAPETTAPAGQLETIAEGVRMILRGIGEDLGRDGLLDTPDRVARMYLDLCSGHSFRPTTFENTERYSGMVVVTNITFYSLCEHHMMPFFGHATIGYLPGERLVGLSKLGRLVEQFARRLQLQERLTEQIADSLDSTLTPRGVAVHVSAEHLCMSARGIQKPGHRTHTYSFRGALEQEPLRGEFLTQCRSASD
jgi:GTP cyclohydrolase I